jgi:glycine/sarcosine N-methyltransferase
MKYKQIEKPPRRAAVRSANPLYSNVLVDMWDDFVDAKKRMKTEGPFLMEQLGICRRRVFDACAGTGVDSIFLLKNGYDVTSNEIDRNFMAKAIENSRREGVRLNFVSHNWLDLDNHMSTGYLDGVLCLGNSIIHLFERNDQLRALRNFLRLLDRNGILIIDVRNYEYMLRNREDILRTKKFRYSGNYVYCGTDKVHSLPVYISDKRIKIEYTHLSTGNKAYIDLYPFRLDEMGGLLDDAGFREITLFSDYRQHYDPRADFYQFVCRR